MTRETTAALERLTPAQRRVLGRILRGESHEEIAAVLDVSYWTVVNHSRAIAAAFGGEPVRKTVARFVVIPRGM